MTAEGSWGLTPLRASGFPTGSKEAGLFAPQLLSLVMSCSRQVNPCTTSALHLGCGDPGGQGKPPDGDLQVLEMGRYWCGQGCPQKLRVNSSGWGHGQGSASVCHRL